MKVLIIGGSGVIGWNLLSSFSKDVEFTYHKNKTHNDKGISLDITKLDETLQVIEKIKPEIVIHTTSLTNVDLCEIDHDLANSINVQGTNNIVECCKNIKSKIIFVSTSFVFDGKKEQYYEDDIKSPSTYYGITKARGEDIVKNSGLPYLILRTDQPYCWIEKWQHTNSVLRVIDTIKSGRKHREIRDWYNNPTYVPEFVGAVKKLIDLNNEGVFHVVGSDYISRYDWSLEIASMFDLNKDMIEPINSSVLNLPAKRNNVNLNNTKLSQIGFKMNGVRAGLTKMHNEM